MFSSFMGLAVYLAFQSIQCWGGGINLVPRVLRLFVQWVVSGAMEKRVFWFAVHCNLLTKNHWLQDSPESLPGTTRWPRSLRNLGTSSQWSNARRRCNSRRNFTKENTDKCQKFYFNSKTWRPFWKLTLFTLSVCWKWSNWHPQVLSARNSVYQEIFRHRFHTNFTLINVWTDSTFKVLED